MLCKVCKNDLGQAKIEIRNGYICQDCYNALPESAKASIENFSAKQISQIKKMFHEPANIALVNCGSFKLCKNSVQINKKEIELKNIQKISLNFHPKVKGQRTNTVVGILTCVIETKFPRYRFEEPFYQKNILASYSINGKNISYGYSYEIEVLFKLIQKCISDGSYDMTSYMQTYKQMLHINRANKENAQKSTNSQSKTNAQTQNNTQYKKQTQYSNYQKKATQQDAWQMQSDPSKTPFEKAKALFGVEIPYTEETIRKKRNILMKKYHPDVGGSEEKCKTINEAYTLLLKFVS